MNKSIFLCRCLLRFVLEQAFVGGQYVRRLSLVRLVAVDYSSSKGREAEHSRRPHLPSAMSLHTLQSAGGYGAASCIGTVVR